MSMHEERGATRAAAGTPGHVASARGAPRVPDLPADSKATFRSILFPPGINGAAVAWVAQAPACLHDLNLDQVLGSIFSAWYDGQQGEDLPPFFYTRSRDPRVIRYRQAVFHDLERSGMAELLAAFNERLRGVQRSLEYARGLPYATYRHLLVCDAAAAYCAALRQFDGALAAAAPRSVGLQALGAWVHAQAQCTAMRALEGEATALQAQLEPLRYALFIKRGGIVVRPYRGEPDYSARVLALFARFGRDGETTEHTLRAPDPWLNHVEAGVLDLVARVFPDVFARLARYAAAHADFFAPTLALFVRQWRFYEAWRRCIAPLQALGLPFCYPEVSATEQTFCSRQGFDLALAQRLAAQRQRVVTNDAELAGAERILIVSGPNQGGKTTFARAFGQLHYLAALGCPVPGRALRIFLCDAVYTHFERREDPAELRSKLEDDMLRVRAIYAAATPASVIVLNEIISSTPWRDQVFLSRKVLEATRRLGALALCVTFVDELAAPGPEVVSMVAEVDADDAARRTYRLVRRAADGLAYALTLAEQHGVSYARLTQRLDARTAP